MFFLRQVPDNEKCPYSQVQTQGLSVKDCAYLQMYERERAVDSYRGAGDKDHQSIQCLENYLPLGCITLLLIVQINHNRYNLDFLMLF